MDGTVIVQLRTSLNRLRSERDELLTDVMEERGVIGSME